MFRLLAAFGQGSHALLLVADQFLIRLTAKT
jgi:hypothetical protein